MSAIHANLIGGEWVRSATAAPNINPANLEEIVGQYTQGSREDLYAAVSAAKEAQPGWSRAGAQTRSDILEAIGVRLIAQQGEIGELLAREEGKTYAEAMAEVHRAGQIFKFYAGEALRAHGETIPSVRPNVSIETRREPVGVIGLITPWNFPIAIPAWKVAPALAFGNAVILKPADLVPGSAWAMANIIHEAGCPPGVFNLVMGRGSQVGEAMLESTGIDAISFTGSQHIGARIAGQCALRFRPCQLEMGGKPTRSS